MADIRNYIYYHLLEPLKSYPTVIQDTMLSIITDELEKVYTDTRNFPTILSPTSDRLDILKAIAEQFAFSIREEADLQEQIDILENILYLYRRRGSIETIENMWKYYGGDLPRDVKVVIPSYKVFRYSLSALSGSHQFVNGGGYTITLDTPSPEDIPPGSSIVLQKNMRVIVTPGIAKGSYVVPISNTEGLAIGDKVLISDVYEGYIRSISGINERNNISINRSGVYEIRLTNNTYPIDKLKDFLLKELVAAGNEIYFKNIIGMSTNSLEPYTNPYKYRVVDDKADIKLSIELTVSNSKQLSAWSDNAYLSGKGAIFLEILRKYVLVDEKNSILKFSRYDPKEIFIITKSFDDQYYANCFVKSDLTVSVLREISTIYDKYFSEHIIESELKDKNTGEILISPYPGYFILGSTSLGNVVI